MRLLSYTCTQSDLGRRVYHILRGELGLSASLVKRLKAGDGIRLNGAPVYTTVLVSPGDVVSADVLCGERQADLLPEPGDLEILYESADYLAVNKPAGLLTHPSLARPGGTLANFAAAHLAPQGCACHLVNRLDRDTSGCVLFAKSAHGKTLLAGERLDKHYLGVVWGTPEPPEGVIDAPILRAEPRNMRRIVHPDGHPALTRYRLLKQGEGCSLLGFQLETGRTHQIRVHLAHLGHPLLGDRLYGHEASLALSEKWGIEAHLLHADRLSFPDGGRTVTVNAPVRRDGVRVSLLNMD